jgi:hypothetical protein
LLLGWCTLLLPLLLLVPWLRRWNLLLLPLLLVGAWLLAWFALEEGRDLLAAATCQAMHLMWLHLPQQVGQGLQRGPGAATAVAATASPAGRGCFWVGVSCNWHPGLGCIALLLLLLRWGFLSHHQVCCCCHQGLTHRNIIHPQLLQWCTTTIAAGQDVQAWNSQLT